MFAALWVILRYHRSHLIYNFVANLTVTLQSLQELDAKEAYMHLKNQKASKNVLLSSFWSVHTMQFSKYASSSSIFKIYLFQNLPTEYVLFSRVREAYP